VTWKIDPAVLSPYPRMSNGPEACQPALQLHKKPPSVSLQSAWESHAPGASHSFTSDERMDCKPVNRVFMLRSPCALQTSRHCKCEQSGSRRGVCSWMPMALRQVLLSMNIAAPTAQLLLTDAARCAVVAGPGAVTLLWQHTHAFVVAAVGADGSDAPRVSPAHCAFTHVDGGCAGDALAINTYWVAELEEPHVGWGARVSAAES
jgi:hypothetical protein